MSKYNVAWKASNSTLIIKPEDAKDTKTETIVGSIVVPELGQVPSSQTHPEPGEHLRNLAFKQGADDYRFVTVVNKTDNDRLDKYEREADEPAAEDEADAPEVVTE